MTPQQKIQAAKSVAANQKYHMSDEVRKRLVEMIEVAETAMGFTCHDGLCAVGDGYDCNCGLDQFLKGEEDGH